MTETKQTKLGEKIQAIRTSRGLSLNNVAGRAGVSPASLSLIERGLTRRPGSDTITRIAAGLNISPRELVEGTGLSYAGLLPRKVSEQTSIDYAVDRLEETLESLRVREGEPTPNMQSLLPLLGSIPAGDPQEAIAEANAFFRCSEGQASSANFVLRVEGDSMYPDLHDGDFIGLRCQDTAEPNQTVAAINPDNEAALKVYRENSRKRSLESLNPTYPPITGKFRIIAVAVWCFRAEEPEAFIERRE